MKEPIKLPAIAMTAYAFTHNTYRQQVEVLAGQSLDALGLSRTSVRWQTA